MPAANFEKRNTRIESVEQQFPLLAVEELAGLEPASADDVAIAVSFVTKSTPTARPVQSLANLHEMALKTLEPPSRNTMVDTKSNQVQQADADAYDEYFSVVRFKADPRRILAFGTLSAFCDLFIDMKAGTVLDAVGLSSLCTAEYELFRLIAPDEELYSCGKDQ